MLNIIILHCPACYGALNVPITSTSTLFKTYEISISYLYSYGSNSNGSISYNNFNLSLIRNIRRFSLIFLLPYYYLKTEGVINDNISTLHGIDLGVRFFPVYAKFSKHRTIFSALLSYKLPLGFYAKNNQYEDITSYISIGSGYAFIYNKTINYGEIIYSKATKENSIQSDRARAIFGLYYSFSTFEIGPVINWVYQKYLNSNELTLGLSYGFKIFDMNINLSAHKSLYYKGKGIDNDFSLELVLRGGFR